MNKNRVIKNASWIIGAQIAKSLLGVLISMMTARYLGPSNYGLINYASSIVAFVAPIMYLGFNNTLVQELFDNPEKEGEMLGTAMGMSFFSALLCIGGIAAFAVVANAGEKDTLLVCMLYSILLIFQSMDLVQYWFQVKLLSKYSSIASFCAYIVVSGYRIFLLLTGKSIVWFAVSNALDYLVISILLIVLYCRLGEQKLSFRYSTGKQMLKKSKYYIVSNIMIVIYAQTDRIMLKTMVNDTETGYYSAAVFCAQLASFVFTAVIDSLRPSILAEKGRNEDSFERGTVCLYSIVIYGALLYSLFMTIFAAPVIDILYGEAYGQAVPVLRVIVWYCSASYLGGARDIWILAENKQKHLLVVNALGSIMNVMLNLLLIPRFQALGAAVASVITQYMMNIVFISIYRPTRRNGYLMLQAAKPSTILEVVGKLFHK